MRVVWSELALERVLETAERIRWGKPKAASRWADRLFDSVATLTDSPGRGRVVPEVERQDVRELLIGSHRFIYRVDDDGIVVMTVRHGSRPLDPSEIQ